LQVFFGPVWGSFLELLLLQEAPKATSSPKRGQILQTAEAPKALLYTTSGKAPSEQLPELLASLLPSAPPVLPLLRLSAPPVSAGPRSVSANRRRPAQPGKSAASGLRSPSLEVAAPDPSPPAAPPPSLRAAPPAALLLATFLSARPTHRRISSLPASPPRGLAGGSARRHLPPARPPAASGSPPLRAPPAGGSAPRRLASTRPPPPALLRAALLFARSRPATLLLAGLMSKKLMGKNSPKQTC